MGHNPLDQNRIQTRCKIRQSVNHWSQNGPDNNNTEHNTYVVNEVVLYQTDYDSPQEFKHLMSEIWSSALLDCGASKIVCDKERLNQHISNLPEHQQQKVPKTTNYTPSKHVHCFGDGRKITAIESVTFPAKIGA